MDNLKLNRSSRSEYSSKENFLNLINDCKDRFPYTGNKWDVASWDITDFEKKSLKSRPKRLRLVFALTSERSGSRKERVEFSPAYSDLIKALIITRYLERGVGFGPQQTIVVAFRYLYQVIAEANVQIEELQNKHFVRASEILKNREAPSSCYRIGNSLEQISKLIDRFYLTKVRTSFVSSFKRTTEYDPLSERSFERSSKLQLSEDALKGILILDQTIKDDNPERLIVEMLKLLLFTGFRISELLTLERNCLLLKVENGEEFVGIRYYPMKSGHKKTRIKWFGDLTGKLVKVCVYSIQKLTLDAHEVARWLVQNEGQSFLRVIYRGRAVLTIEDIKELLGTESLSTAYSALIRKGISPPYTLDKFDDFFRPKEEDLLVLQDSSTGYRLTLDKAMFAIFKESYSNNRFKKIYHPMLFNEGVFILGVSGKDDPDHPRVGIFEKYGIKDESGNPIHLTTHMFRRFLSTIYNEGGVPLTILTKIFGRSNPKDTLSYIYTTPKRRTENARKLFKEGSIIGPKAEVARKIPIANRDEFIDTVVESIHHLGFGYCSHDWSTLPCEKHVQCLDNCADFHMDKSDPKTKQYLKNQIDWAEKSLKSAKEEVKDGTYGAEAQVSHYERVIVSARGYLEQASEEEAE